MKRETAFVKAAQAAHGGKHDVSVVIQDDAPVMLQTDGAYVQAWVWVHNALADEQEWEQEHTK